QVTETPAGRTVRLDPGPLGPLRLVVSGDASSAAVLATAAALVPGSDLVLERISVNPSRIGFFDVLQRMGGRVDYEPLSGYEGPEPIASIRVRFAPLQSFRIDAQEVPALIDELPLLGLLATSAEGPSEVRGAAELRVKESDRIAGLISGLRELGADAEELQDGFLVRGPTALRGGRCHALGDHRLAMTFTLAGLMSRAPVVVVGGEFIADSFPGFSALLAGLA
ncbi:MAG: 3-phosphoshikimate 1-carboxyvinyltransferase, partial [Candidatus Dormiibacterota bacterium]